jgi:anti-sigma regulatory factor (Ser/Thr protein kinase)
MSASDDRSLETTILFLRMEPPWVFIDDIRRFVEAFCAAACPEAGREEQLALATHELVQNAVTNGTSREIELRLAVDPRAERVSVSVTNGCAPSALQRLRERLARIYLDQDPLAAYVRTMGEDLSARGGLGLARVRFEAGLELDLSAGDDRVTVHASGPLRTHDGSQLRAS